MQSQPATNYLRNDNFNTKATSLPAAGMQTFAAGSHMSGPFDIELPAMKNMDQVPSGINALPTAPAQQSIKPNVVGHANKPLQLATGLSFRQESLEALASGELTRSKNGGSQTLFADVLEQLSSKEESLPSQAALYRLPSMHFLESLLDEMDSRSASIGNPPAEPPLYLPLDSFDLPGLDSPGAQVNDLVQLGLPPLPRRVHSAHAGIGNALGHDHQQAAAAAAMRVRPPVPPFDMPQPNYMSMVPNAGSAAPSPQRGMPMPNRGSGPAAFARQTANALEELYGFEEAEVSLQTSKSGRVRKVTSFTGAKRKLGDMTSQVSAPAALAGEPYSMQHTQDSDLTTGSDAGEEVDREFRKSTEGKKSKRTVCLNCGSHQTPQWRCGPLGPRTLCNACGVRYKKGLPLSCWPLREGLVLPPGAVLPSTVQVPAGINIITQPLDE